MISCKVAKLLVKVLLVIVLFLPAGLHGLQARGGSRQDWHWQGGAGGGVIAQGEAWPRVCTGGTGEGGCALGDRRGECVCVCMCVVCLIVCACVHVYLQRLIPCVYVCVYVCVCVHCICACGFDTELHKYVNVDAAKRLLSQHL